MASLFRPSYTKIDPATGNRVMRKVRKWYGKYRDAAGRVCRKPLSPVKTAAMAMLTELVRRVEFQKAGLLDERAEHLKQPIAAALAEFRRHLESTLRSTRHVSETARIIGKVVAACQLTTLADLQGASERIERYLAERREAGVSHRTVNGELVAVRSFCRWLVQRKRLYHDPTSTLARLNQDLDRRRRRRALSNDEVWKLYTTTQKSKRVVSRLTGPDRAVL